MESGRLGQPVSFIQDTMAGFQADRRRQAQIEPIGIAAEQIVGIRCGDPGQLFERVSDLAALLVVFEINWRGRDLICLLYTSDAADDLPCVYLGGRRIIKKK